MVCWRSADSNPTGLPGRKLRLFARHGNRIICAEVFIEKPNDLLGEPARSLILYMPVCDRKVLSKILSALLASKPSRR